MKFSEIASTVNFVLADDLGLAYPASTVYPFIAEAELRIVDSVPGANPVTETIQSVAGSHQQIPAGGIRLLTVETIGGRSARLIDRVALDEVNPQWRSAPPASYSSEYIYDERIPKRFLTMPITAGVTIELSYDRIPDSYDFIATPDPDIVIDRTYSPVLADYAIWRCLSRADENTPEAVKASQHYQSFMQAIGTKPQINGAQSPRRRGTAG